MAKVNFLINTQTQEEVSALNFLNEDYIVLGDLRRKQKESILENKPLYICANCKQPLALKGKPKNNKKFYLAHLRDSKDCDWKSGDERSKFEIHEEMFHRVRESEEHKELKSFIVEKLKKDKTFTDVKSEKRFNSTFSDKYKVPDVSTTKIESNGFVNIETNIVLEIQLTSTYLDVIIERERFYYSNSVNIIWIFSEFSEDLSKTKMTEDDILFSNKKNVFILDDEAKRISNETGKLHLKNIYIEPFNNRRKIDYRWSQPKILNINEISFDPITGKSFSYNFECERARLLYAKKLENNKELFFQIEDCLRKSVVQEVDFTELLKEKELISDRELLDAIIKSQNIIRLIFEIIYMDKENKIFDPRFKNLKENKEARIISLLNHVFNPSLSNKSYLNFFLKAIDYYGKSKYLISIDKKGLLVKKLQNLKRYSLEDNSILSHSIALKFLFPELFYLSAIPKKYN